MERQPDAQDESQLGRIRTMLRHVDAISLAGSLGQLLIGLGILIGVGIFVASVMTYIVYSLADSTWIGWTGWFAVYVVILTPLLVWYERHSRPQYLVDSLMSVDPNPSSRGEMEMGRFSVGVGAASELLVSGPRKLVDGIRGLRGQHSTGQKAIFERASRLALDLYRVPGGVPIKQVLYPPEDMQLFARVVDLLDKHGWIGKSSDGKSIWLDSTWRGKFQAADGHS